MTHVLVPVRRTTLAVGGVGCLVQVVGLGVTAFGAWIGLFAAMGGSTPLMNIAVFTDIVGALVGGVGVLAIDVGTALRGGRWMAAWLVPGWLLQVALLVGMGRRDEAGALVYLAMFLVLQRCLPPLLHLVVASGLRTHVRLDGVRVTWRHHWFGAPLGRGGGWALELTRPVVRASGAGNVLELAPGLWLPAGGEGDELGGLARQLTEAAERRRAGSAPDAPDERSRVEGLVGPRSSGFGGPPFVWGAAAVVEASVWLALSTIGLISPRAFLVVSLVGLPRILVALSPRLDGQVGDPPDR